MSGGAPMPVEVMKAFEEKFGVEIFEGYGLSETSPVASFNMPGRPRTPGSIGYPVWGVELAILDDKDRALPDGERGEICIRGHNVMKGYWKRAEATAETMRSGWFHSGDIGIRDPNGSYRIVDRVKDMIIRGGFNVYPREVEEVLYAHPAIVEAAVLGVPHRATAKRCARWSRSRRGRARRPTRSSAGARSGSPRTSTRASSTSSRRCRRGRRARS